MGQLEIANQIAVQNLQVRSTELGIASGNIASSSIAGYSQKSAKSETVVVDGMNAGVRIQSIQRNVDREITKNLNQQTAIVETYKTLNTYLDQIQDLFGTPNSQSSISANIAEIQTTLADLLGDPPSSVRQSSTVLSLEKLTKNLNILGTKIQSMRSDNETAIARGVSTINNNFKQINTLNVQIKTAQIAGQPIGDLLDKRDQLLHETAEYMDVKWYEKDGGDIMLMTVATSQALIDGGYKTLAYLPKAVLTKDVTYTGVPGSGIDGIRLGTNQDDITSEISNGRLAANIQLRDTILPNLHDQIDLLTGQMMEEANRAYNSGSALQGSQTLTGSHDVDATKYTLLGVNPTSARLDAFGGAYGSLDLAITDSTGANPGAGVGNTLSLDLDQLQTDLDTLHQANGAAPGYVLTLQDVMNAINGRYAGVITDPSATIQPAGWTQPWPPVGPNDTLANPIAGLATASGEASPFADPDFPAGNFMRIFNNKLEISNGNANYAIALNDANTTFSFGTPARSTGFNFMFGLNDLFTLDATAASSAQDIKLRSDIAADPSKLSRGRLTNSPTGWAVRSGDGTNISALQTIFTSNYSFATAGGLGSTTTDYGKYAANIISNNAQIHELNTVNLKLETGIKEEFQTQNDNKSGVNLDEQFADLITIQSSYVASTQVIQMVQKMYDYLLSTIR